MSRIFTQASLQQRSLPELRAAFAEAQQELVQSAPGSNARRAALINLDAISLAIAERMAGPRLQPSSVDPVSRAHGIVAASIGPALFRVRCDVLPRQD